MVTMNKEIGNCKDCKYFPIENGNSYDDCNMIYSLMSDIYIVDDDEYCVNSHIQVGKDFGCIYFVERMKN